MLIHDMTRQASIELLTRARLCRLACAHEEQPYITPIHCAYESNCLYSFSRLGQKVTWMRANPLVCVEAEELVSRQDWATVIVFGRYEELPDTPQYGVGRTHAYELLQKRPVWWEPGYMKTELSDKVDPVEVVYFRIHVDQISGHRGIPDPASGRELSAPVGWLRRILGRSEHKPG
jgi:uncharacterized protein